MAKILLKPVFQGTSSQFTGELQNLILSIAYVLPAVLYYGRHKTKKGAVTGLVIGSVISVIAAIFTNLYIIFLFYLHIRICRYTESKWYSGIFPEYHFVLAIWVKYNR